MQDATPIKALKAWARHFFTCHQHSLRDHRGPNSLKSLTVIKRSLWIECHSFAQDNIMRHQKRFYSSICSPRFAQDIIYYSIYVQLFANSASVNSAWKKTYLTVIATNPHTTEQAIASNVRKTIHVCEWTLQLLHKIMLIATVERYTIWSTVCMYRNRMLIRIMA